MKKKFAIVIFSKEIIIKKFEHKDELDSAIATLNSNNKNFIVLKWHHGNNEWAQLYVYE